MDTSLLMPLSIISTVNDGTFRMFRIFPNDKCTNPNYRPLIKMKLTQSGEILIMRVDPGTLMHMANKKWIKILYKTRQYEIQYLK